MGNQNDRVCPGGCNRTWREAELTYRTAHQEWLDTAPADRSDKPPPHTVPAVPGDPVWCTRCTTGIKTALAELDDLASLYGAEADGHRTGPTTEPVSGSKDRRSPSPAVDDLDELYSVLHGWETAYRNEDPQARRGYLANSITTVVAWLVTHFDGIIAHGEIAVDFGRDVRRWHRVLREKVKGGTGKHSKARPCPRCELRTLTWREGDDYVACENIDCGRMLTMSEYDEYDRLSAAAGFAEAS